MLAALAALSLGALVWASLPARACPETGARRSWQADKRAAERRALRRMRKEAPLRLAAAEAEGRGEDAARLRALVAESERGGRRGAARTEARKLERLGVSCCDAGADDWRASRDVYDRWVPPSPMTFDDAKRACLEESKELSALGDYSKPASRRCVLGKMHQNKLRQWEDCRAACSGEGMASWDAGEGRTAYAKMGKPTLYLRPLSLGWWAVEERKGSGFRELDRFGVYDDAMADVESRLADDDVPF